MTTLAPVSATPTLAALTLLQFGGSGNPMVGTLVMYAAIFAIFWFVVFRPQQRHCLLRIRVVAPGQRKHP